MTDTILVTGGNGMLGEALRPLLPGAIFATREDADLRDPAAAEALIARARPAALVHLAAVAGGVKENAAHNLELFEENLAINLNVLRAAARRKVRRLIALLSSCAYPAFPDRPTAAADLHHEPVFAGNLGYGFSKRALEVHVRLVREQQGLPWITFTPVTMYGPHDDFSPERGHVVSALIRKCVAARAAGGPFTVWGSGAAVRQFAFAPDVAGLVAAAAADAEREGGIIAPDQGVTIRALAGQIAAAAGYQGEIRYDASEPEGLARKILAGDPRLVPPGGFTPLAEGLRQTIEWYGRTSSPEIPNPKSQIPTGS